VGRNLTPQQLRRLDVAVLGEHLLEGGAGIEFGADFDFGRGEALRFGEDLFR